MPEGDTLHRTAASLRPHLVGRTVTAASARLPGPRAELLVGRLVSEVTAYGKHLLIRFDSGLELRSHLGMHGSWHRYKPGERWRRPPARARFVIEVPGAVAVCFDAPDLELFETRAEPIHPLLSRLGPDVLGADFDGLEARRRLRASPAAARSIAEGLLDQGVAAGIGNIYKNEALFIERVHPFLAVDRLDDPTLDRLIATARLLLLASIGAAVGAGAGPLVPARAWRPGRADRRWAYRRAGRPCLRCGTVIAARRHGEPPRTTYWCPGCQPVSLDAGDARRTAPARHTMAR